MDTEKLARVAVSLEELAERETPMFMQAYQDLREEVFNLVGDDRLLGQLFPANVRRSSQGLAVDAAKILGVVAAYLRALSTESGPRAARLTAATDLMEQAERLYGDRDVTEIAPIVIAGAALEEVLRDLVEVAGVEVPGSPGLTSYAQALRSGLVITADDLKEVLSLAAVRNDAAHGRIESLSRERAGVFLDRVNLFLRQLRKVPQGMPPQDGASA